MKRVAVITIISDNFGNRLQNYAVQEVMRELGLSPETLRPPQTQKRSQSSQPSEKPSMTAKEIIKKLLRFLMHPLKKVKKLKKKIKKMIKSKSNKALKERRKANFGSFNQYIAWSAHSLQDDFPDGCDHYLLGSDQVWNTEWFKGKPWKENAFLLAFAPSEKRICFSPSFGIRELPEEWKPLFKEQLPKFKRISVREDAGAKIVKELTGQDAEVLIDPTCMLDRDKWMEIAKKPKGFQPAKPYILTYFLGGRSERVNQDLQSYANQYHLRICNLVDISEKKLYPSGPSEFVWLIANASLVLTDSFHGCVFSFLFQKPFVVYSREGKTVNMMSRLDTFFGKFDLARKFADSGLPNDLFECDYQKGFARLEEERKKAKRFLLESLS